MNNKFMYWESGLRMDGIRHYKWLYDKQTNKVLYWEDNSLHRHILFRT